MDAQQILLDTHDFDYLILGTGLTDSLFAAFLAKRKQKVLVLDLDRSYSSSLQTLNLKELISLFSNVPNVAPGSILSKKQIFSNFYMNPQFQAPAEYKGYNIDLQPKVLFSTSLTVDLMKEADMDKYMEFRAVDSIYHYDNEGQKFIETPSSKGQIFVHKDLSLIEKRTLFKTLQSFITVFHMRHGVKIDPNSTAEFDKTVEVEEEFQSKYEQFKSENCTTFLHSLGLTGKVKEILLYTLASCEENPETSPLGLTTEELFRRMFKFVKSLGVHSKLPFLYTMYGTGDIPQAFSRIAAVYGSIFIINEDITVERIERNQENVFQVYTGIAGDRKFLTCKQIIVGLEYQEEILKVLDEEFIKQNVIKKNKRQRELLLRMIVILDGELFKENEDEPIEERKKLPLVYVIPPGNKQLKNQNPVTVMLFGPNTYSCPKGRLLFHVKTVVTSEKEENNKEFEENMREFLMEKVKEEGNEWKVMFSGVFLQEKMESSFDLKENCGMFLIQNNDFSMDLDGYFQEFVDNVAKLSIDFNPKCEDSGFFVNKGGENEELEEKEEKSEINKLLEKLDGIVLNKDEKEKIQINDEIKEKEIKSIQIIEETKEKTNETNEKTKENEKESINVNEQKSIQENNEPKVNEKEPIQFKEEAKDI